MLHSTSLLLLSVLVRHTAFSAPTQSDFFGRELSYEVREESLPNYPAWNEKSNIIPEAVRGSKGATIIGPHNIPTELQNPDTVAPPSTDHGHMPNLKWPFALSHTRLSDGGWSRHQTVNELPVATALAGVNMRLEPGATRELHWHNTAEWAYVLKGDVRISTVTPEGQVFTGDASQGDLWYFPSGFPHYLQAKNTTEDGAEFVLVFDDGTFSEDKTFSLTDWLFHTPKEVLAKNFDSQDLAIFDHIPEELYIFKTTPPPDDLESDLVVPNDTPNPYVFPLSKMEPTKLPGGSIKIADTSNFKVSEKISAVEVTVEPGKIRELHWHPTEPEWSFFIKGEARITVFATSSNAHSFDFEAGDVGYIPSGFGHYVENTGNSTLVYLEVFKSGRVQDISLTQWLALTPPRLIKAHLGFSDETIAKLSSVKHEVV